MKTPEEIKHKFIEEVYGYIVDGYNKRTGVETMLELEPIVNKFLEAYHARYP